MGKRLLNARLAEELDITLQTLCDMTGKKESQYLSDEQIAEIKSQYHQHPTENPIDVYQKWEDDEVHFTGKFRRLKRFRKKVMRGNKMVDLVFIRYRTPTGRDRNISEKVVASRMRAGQLPYYLLDVELEKAGIERISDFEGAPTMETNCTACNEVLFTHDGDLHRHLRDVLEAILTDKVKPRDVTFRRRHSECYEAQQIRDRIEGAKSEAVSEVRMRGGRDTLVEAEKIAEAKAHWEQRVEGFLGHLRRKGVPASRIQKFEQQFAAAIEGVK